MSPNHPTLSLTHNSAPTLKIGNPHRFPIAIFVQSPRLYIRHPYKRALVTLFINLGPACVAEMVLQYHPCRMNKGESF
jgi:hypothetical protein